MTELRAEPARDEPRRGRIVIEIWEDGGMIGVIYPAERGVRIESKYFQPGEPLGRLDPGPSSGLVPPALTIRIWDGPPKS